ncbi:Nucleoporin 43kD [Carabus blaptoides fortunei]
MSQNVHGTFVSEKISKIRWRPDQFENSHSFVTGSWDNDENTIKLWKLVTTDEDDIYPCELKSYRANGDVTEIKFINQDLLVASTSDGSVNLLRVTDRENEAVDIKEQVNWKQIHKFKNSDPTSCTGLSTYDEDIVTIGEDGRINLLTSRRETLVRSIENADSCSLHCVSFLKYNEVLTGNLRGQMKIWDLRKSDDKPASTFMLNGEQIAATCLTYHPTQRHMVLAGDEEGSLTVWDLRLNTFPVTLLSAHSSALFKQWRDLALEYGQPVKT